MKATPSTMPILDFTHNPATLSWVPSANAADTDFPLQNLPYGVFETGDAGPRVGVAIGGQVLDLRRAAAAGLALPASLTADSLAPFMAEERPLQRSVRQALFLALATGSEHKAALQACLIPQDSVQMQLPCQVRNYTDFLTGIYHAQNCGRLVGRPLGEHYKWVPIAYHGRASSVVVSGTPVQRPWGQSRDADGQIGFRPTAKLDYELELGVLVGRGNPLREPIPVERAADHWFGLVLLNDWSARDVQSWEGQPLGPFLSKNFATSISPWVVTQDALAPFRTPLKARRADDPQPLPYLRAEGDAGYAIQLEVWLQGRRITANDFGHTAYWTINQMVAHHTSGGCNLLTGDLLGTGTQSGPAPHEGGCLLELSQGGKTSVDLGEGGQRSFLLDGDKLSLKAFCERPGIRRIGFGACTGDILPARPIGG